MAITGAGTRANPYICETWDDIIQATSENNKYVKVKPLLQKTSDTNIINNKLYFDSEGNVIANPTIENINNYYENIRIFDGNDISPTGINWVIYSNTFDGNGSTFNNFTATSDYYCITLSDTYGNTIKNCIFSNIKITGAATFMYGWSTAREIINCIFSGITSSSGPFFCQSNTAFLRCAFNIMFNNSAGFIRHSSVPTFQNCNVKFSGNCLTEYLYTNSSGQSGSMVHENTLVTGTCPAKYYTIGYYSNTWRSYDSIINMTFNSDNVIANQDDTKPTTNILINSNKLNGATVTSQLITQVTDSQLRDVEYLQSINFPVGD